MKALCNCWNKSNTCAACYMANLEGWNHIHAMAISTEAQRRLEEDLRFLESINVWHLVNLHSNPHSLYSYGERLDVLNPNQLQGFPQNPYQNHPSAYLQGNQYLSAPGGDHHQNTISSISPSTALPYPDLIIHAAEITSSNNNDSSILTKLKEAGANTVQNDKLQPEEILESTNDHRFYKGTSSIRETSVKKEIPLIKRHQLLSIEPDDYDSEDRISPDDGKKSVKFTSDTIFVERDMNSPFWKAFSERRRLRRINKQRKQLNAQIASASYQPSIIEIVKSAFRSKDNNGNDKKRTNKEKVLVYENSKQIQENLTAQYIYNTNPKRSKFFRMLTCQCYSSSSSC